MSISNVCVWILFAQLCYELVTTDADVEVNEIKIRQWLCKYVCKCKCMGKCIKNLNGMHCAFVCMYVGLIITSMEGGSLNDLLGKSHL